MTDLTVVTEPLGGSALALAAQRGDVPERWYGPRPASRGEWRAHVQRVAREFADGAWLAALGPALAASGDAAARLRRVASRQGVVVTTGQQPGLFGGPLYTLTKAITALALADEVEEQTGVAAAAVFWAATDDADFDEARWANVVIGGEVIHVALRDAPRPGTPMSDVPLGDLGDGLATLEQASGSAPFVDALEAVRAAYAAGATVGGAYVRLLRAVLEPLGVAVLDASHPAVRRQGHAVLGAALRRAPAIAAALADRAAELRARGFEPQVAEVGDLSLVFALTGGVKRRIRIDETLVLGEPLPPEILSPNVLLRPVLERAILPTVGYAAGPGELAYFAQVSAVAGAIDAERPLAVPRWSATIVEPPVWRALGRLGAHYTDLRDPHELEGRLARAALPPAVVAALRRVREAVEQATGQLVSDADAGGLIPEAAVTGAQRSLLDRLRRLERRYVAAVKRREDDVMRDVATARAHLYPDGKRQERVLSFIPVLARHGPQLVEAMRRAAHAHARSLLGVDTAPRPAMPAPPLVEGRAHS